MRRNICALLFLIVATLSGQTKMSASEIAEFKAQVQHRASEIQTISSEFVQYKHLAFLSNDIKTTGNLRFKSPSTIKWEYLEPFQYAVLFKNDHMYINDQGKKSNIDIGSNELFENLNTLIVNSIKGSMFDQEKFTIAYNKVEGGTKVNFIPKNEAFLKYIKSFEILFNEQFDVEIFKMIEPSDDYTKIEFKNKVINKPIGDEVFTP